MSLIKNKNSEDGGLLEMLDYILNRRLRENYQKVLTLHNADEINDFLSQLCESERKDLLSFAIGWAVQNRKRTGTPVCEYFLVHIMEFISPEDEKLIGIWIKS